MRPPMIRILALALVARRPRRAGLRGRRGLPDGRPAARGCARCASTPDHVCIDDPTAPGGRPDRAEGRHGPARCARLRRLVGCSMPLPDAPSAAVAGHASGAALALPLVGLLALIGVVAAR